MVTTMILQKGGLLAGLHDTFAVSLLACLIASEAGSQQQACAVGIHQGNGMQEAGVSGNPP